MINSNITRRQLSKMYDNNSLPTLPAGYDLTFIAASAHSWVDMHSKNNTAQYTDAQYNRALKKMVIDYYCEILNINR